MWRFDGRRAGGLVDGLRFGIEFMEEPTRRTLPDAMGSNLKVSASASYRSDAVPDTGNGLNRFSGITHRGDLR